MATATLSDSEHKKQRASLQARLENFEGLKLAKNRAAEELAMAEQLVKTFQRVPEYLNAFELAFARASQQFNDLTSTIPHNLRNSCQDERLRSEFENATAVRRRLVQEYQHTRQGIKSAEQDLASTRTRISDQRGEPAILKQGDPLPWGEGFIQKAFTAMQVSLGQASISTWAITNDLQNIAFAPSVDASNAKFYSDAWFSDLKSLRMAKVANEETEARLADAETVLADVKQRMIWSPV
jgi:hypothetical protein